VTQILAPTSVGELIDKITILGIKLERLKDPDKLYNVKKELKMLHETAQHHAIGFSQGQLKQLTTDLSAVNQLLWDVEDEIRNCERRDDFTNHFIDLARSVYRLNDKRAALKRQINEVSGSHLTEEKSYTAY
jgi:hypothetical protein